jgi:hypothetical protein
MNKLPKILKTIGNIWILLIITLIILSYSFFVFVKRPSFDELIWSIINFWNLLITILLFLPGYFCIVASEKLAKKNHTEDDVTNEEFNIGYKKARGYLKFFSSPISIPFIFLVYLGIVIWFVLSRN